MAVTMATGGRNLVVNQMAIALSGGKLVFKTSGGVEVATLTLSAVGSRAFNSASAGSATAKTITDDTDATGGTISNAKFLNSGSTEMFGCTVSTSGADINMSSLVIGAGDTVSVTALTMSCPA